ncbi:MAG: EamA family transporter [Bacteroidetes bacterium]|nr:MAG: EamA family transporter [Bacteroidota bacterium]
MMGFISLFCVANVIQTTIAFVSVINVCTMKPATGGISLSRSLIFIHIAVFVWGFTGVLGRAITVDAVWLVQWRMLITTVSLWVLFGALGLLEKMPFKRVVLLAGIGAILAFHWVCFYGSIHLANVSIALTCLATSGFLSSLIEPLFMRSRVNISEVLLGVLALAGIAIIYRSNLSFGVGIWVGLMASLLTVLVSVFNKKYVTGFKPTTVTLVQLSGGWLVFTVCMPLLLWAMPTVHWWPSVAEWGYLFILSWVCTIATFFLYIQALQKISAFTANLTLTLEPVYGILLAFVIFKEYEQLNGYFFWGLGCIVLAVAIQLFITIKGSIGSK